jgi:anti-sigma factor RsiW
MVDYLPWWGSLLVKAAKAAPGLAGWAVSASERSQLTTVANDLAVLAFWQDGVLVPLKHIAEDQGTPQDIEEIAAWYETTLGDVTAAGERLKAARTRLVSNRFGINVAQDLDSVIYEKLGPGAIRPRLKGFVDKRSCSAAEARSILKEIEDFNKL